MLVIQIENFTNKTYDDSRYSNLGRIIERSAKTAVILGNFWHNLGYFYLPSGHTDQNGLLPMYRTESVKIYLSRHSSVAPGSIIKHNIYAFSNYI